MTLEEIIQVFWLDDAGRNHSSILLEINTVKTANSLSNFIP